MARLSIRRQLIASVLVTQVILALALVLLASYLTRRQLLTAFDVALHGRAMSLAALVRYSEGPNPVLQFESDLVPPPLDREHPDIYKIVGQDDRIITASSNWTDTLVAANKHHRNYWNAHLQGTRYRVIRLAVPVLDREGPETISPGPLTVFYAAPTTELMEHAWGAAWLTIAGSAVLLALATLVAVWAIGRQLSPLSDLAASASLVSPSTWRLETPASAANTQELFPLTRAMETMLDTLHRAFTSQREFLANAAHELKTPVAILKSTLQLLLQHPRSAEEYRASLDGAVEDVERLERLIHSMLRLARAEQQSMDSGRRDLPQVDLGISCEDALERVRPLAESRGVSLRLDCCPEKVLLAADAEDLDMIWSNLLENAIRYSDKGARVLMTVGTRNGFAEIKVQDWGAGIPEADLPYIFDRFHRADSSRTRQTGGYGLGLAIAKAMVDTYRGDISVQSQAAQGTIMTVRFPQISNHSPQTT